MSQRVAKIINFNFDERFDFAMIIQYIDPESGEAMVKWEKLYYYPKPEALPRVPKFNEADLMKRT